MSITKSYPYYWTVLFTTE